MNRRALTSGLVLLSAMVAGCGASRVASSPATAQASKAPKSPTPSAATTISVEELPPSHPTPPPGRVPGIPVSIRRIVAERKDELRDMITLASVVGDVIGRQRAQTEVATLTQEFSTIELHLDSAESDTLDDTMHKLQALETRIGLLHDALRNANVQAGSPKAVD